MKLCSVPGCGRPFYAKGYCTAHLRRVNKHGHAREDVPIKQYRPHGTGTYRKGYKFIRGNGHPNTLKHGDIAEHILVMSQHLGRPLYPDERVHHINGIRDQNNIENLELWSVSHPAGQRVEDLVQWAKEIIARYESS